MFFAPKEEFTHTGRFYGIPVYLSFINQSNPAIMGRNYIFHVLFGLAILFHDYIRVPLEKMLYLLMGQEFENKGYVFTITGEIDHADQ